MSSRLDGRGHWPKGKPRPSSRRNELDATRIIRGLASEYTIAELSRRTGIADSTLRDWAKGRSFASREMIEKIIDVLLPANSV